MILAKTKIILVFFLLFWSLSSFGVEYYDNKIVTISPQMALPIGIKIWFNESGGSVDGLTSWNKGENFASLGIGHSIWHPYPSKRASFHGGFPQLIRYMEKKGNVTIPAWLSGKKALYCPWRNRDEFLKAKKSPKMVELKNFLQATIPIQAEYMTRKLQEILPDLLASAPIKDRQFINNKFYQLARTPAGIYALVDYLNFKGGGIGGSLKNYQHGTGLLQVLKGMKDAPKGFTNHQAFVWSAKHALAKRVEKSKASKQYARWLPGWFKRLDTYLEGDPEFTQTGNLKNSLNFSNSNTNKTEQKTISTKEDNLKPKNATIQNQPTSSKPNNIDILKQKPNFQPVKRRSLGIKP